MKRLESESIVHLRIGDDITIVVRPINPREPIAAKKARQSTLNLFKRLIRDECGNVSAAKKDKFWTDELKRCEIILEGKCYHEFNVTVVSYAKRAQLLTPNLPANYIDYYMGAGGAGLSVHLDGYATSNSMLLKFNMIPFLEVRRARSMDTSTKSFLDESTTFPTTNKDDLTHYLMQKLDATRGDPVAYIEVLMKYYHRALEMTKS